MKPDNSHTVGCGIGNLSSSNLRLDQRQKNLFSGVPRGEIQMRLDCISSCASRGFDLVAMDMFIYMSESDKSNV